MHPPRGKRFAFFLVVLGVGVLAVCSVGFKHRIVEEWYLWRLESEDFTERLRAARKLSQMRSTKAIPKLIQLLKESDGRKKEASEACGAQTSAGMLIANLVRDTGPAGVASLGQALIDSSNERKYWRRCALRVVGEAKREGMVVDLVELLEDGYLCLRLQAFGALGSIGPEAKEAIPALAKALEDQNHNVRRAAERALEQIQVGEQPKR